MTTPSEAQPRANEERIRAIAYALWEEEGRPDGRDIEHWLRACDLAAAEVSGPEVTEPVWLERKETDLPRDPSRHAA